MFSLNWRGHSSSSTLYFLVASHATAFCPFKLSNLQLIRHHPAVQPLRPWSEFQIGSRSLDPAISKDQQGVSLSTISCFYDQEERQLQEWLVQLVLHNLWLYHGFVLHVTCWVRVCYLYLHNIQSHATHKTACGKGAYWHHCKKRLLQVLVTLRSCWRWFIRSGPSEVHYRPSVAPHPNLQCQ